MKERKRPEEYKMSYETGNNTLEIILDYYKVYFEEMTIKKERENLEACCEKIIRFIRCGYVNISKDKDGNVIVIQKLQDRHKDAKQECEYNSNRLTKAKKQMGSDENESGFGSLYRFMGSLSGNGADWVEGLIGVDHKVMEALSGLFLQCSTA
jgi:hypothetical protein